MFRSTRSVFQSNAFRPYIPLTASQLVSEIKPLINLHPRIEGIVYCQGDGAPYILEVKHEIHHNISKSFRIQRIREDFEKSNGESFVPTIEKLHEVLNKLGVKPQIEEIKSLGKFIKEHVKSQTLLITLSTEHEARLSNENARKENLCLKRRRELLDEGVPKEKKSKSRILSCSMMGKKK